MIERMEEREKQREREREGDTKVSKAERQMLERRTKKSFQF